VQCSVRSDLLMMFR